MATQNGVSLSRRRLVGDVQAGFAEAVDPRLKQRLRRFGVERGKSRQCGIRRKVWFSFQQLVERDLGLFKPIKMRQRRCQCRVRPERDRRLPDRAPRIFHRRFVIRQ